MTTSDRFFITSLFVKDKADSESTVSTTCYLPDFFIFGKSSACISLYIRSYGSVKCRPFSCQAGGRGFESLRSRSLKPRFLVEKSGFFVALLYFPDMTPFHDGVFLFLFLPYNHSLLITNCYILSYLNNLFIKKWTRLWWTYFYSKVLGMILSCKCADTLRRCQAHACILILIVNLNESRPHQR